MAELITAAESTPVQDKSELYHITLLRHGESEGNINGFIQGQRDLPLTENGVEQAKAIASTWKATQMHFDLIISSPLLRARNTAEIISTELGVPLVFETSLIERGFGLIEGRDIKEILAHNPPDFNQPYIKPGEDGESLVEVFNRAGMFLQSLLQRPPGRYLIVSHGAFLNMLLYVIFGLTPHNNPRTVRFNFGNTAYANFTFDAQQHQWRLYEFNNKSPRIGGL